MRNAFALLHPAATAVAGGVGALLLRLVGGFGTMGAWGMGSGDWSWGNGPWMMGPFGGPGYGYGPHVLFGPFSLLAAFVVGAVAGLIVAVVYNAVVLRAEQPQTGTPGPSGTGTGTGTRISIR